MLIVQVFRFSRRYWSGNSFWGFDTMQVGRLTLHERNFVDPEGRDNTFLRNVDVNPENCD